MKLSGEAAALLTTLIWSIGVFPFTTAARRWGSHALNHYRLVLAVIILSCILIFWNGLSFAQLFSLPNTSHWLWFGLSGIIGLTIGDYFSFKSFEILGPRLSTAFTTLSPVAAFLLAFFFIDETLNWIGLSGMLITIAGILWLSTSKKDPAVVELDHKHRFLGLLFALLSPVCQGIGLVFSRKAFLSGGHDFELLAVHAAWLRMITATGSLYMFSLLNGSFTSVHRKIFSNENNGILYASTGALFGPILGMITSMYAVSILDASVAQTIFGLVPVVVLLISIIFFKERIRWFSVFATLLSISGVVLLVWRDKIAELLKGM
ncbi:MAG: hypothetical protein Fur0041_13970 [Bacteroidia bacterium]